MTKEAINKTTGPCVILAGAGTGKTYTIVEKIKNLINKKVYSPEKIVCLTFSNEAVKSLKNRVSQNLPDGKEPVIATFHSFAADILREHGSEINIDPAFKIILPDDAKIMLHKYFKIHPQLCPKYIEAISMAKDLGITIKNLQDYLTRKMNELYTTDVEKSVEMMQFELNTRHIRPGKPSREEQSNSRERLKKMTSLLKLKKFIQAWNAYEKMNEKKKRLDYADLMKGALQLLSKKDTTTLYEYVIIDEFQDTNKMQCDLLEKLAPHKNITIVGDLNQSIYRFRGAYKENFTQFKQFFNVKPEDITTLNKSHRSPNVVLRTAHKLIQNNYKDKSECFEVSNAYNKEGNQIEVYEMLNEREETRKILELIEEERKHVPLEEICIMFRTHHQSKRLKRALDEKNIPYVSITRTAITSLSYIKLVLNMLILATKCSRDKKGGEQAWWALAEALDLPKEDMILIGRELKKELSNKEIKKICTELDLSEKGKAKVKWASDMMDILEKKLTLPASELTKQACELLITPHDDIKKQKEQIANKDKFLALIEEYASSEGQDIEDVLYHLELMDKLNIEIPSATVEQDGIRIMTYHATKGLEYNTVICAGMAHNRFPSERYKSTSIIPSEVIPDIAIMLEKTPEYLHDEMVEEYEKNMHLAEERRLCYVAFTRTKEHLILTYSQEYNNRQSAPSPFLNEIDYTKNNDIKFTRDHELKSEEKLLIETADKSIKPVKKKSFSPSALLLFTDCQKKYEYKYVYNMPEKEPSSWEEINLGSFVHYLIEQGVKNNFKDERLFIELARTHYADEEWKSINLEEAISLIRIFFHRNKNKYSSSSLTEMKLSTKIDGITFEGYADRIDVHPEGLEIVDYKTGRALITAQHRNWQLGLYALAAQNLGLGPVKRLTLDMLRHEKPIEFELKPDGIARAVHMRNVSFNLEDVKKELASTARSILEAYENGFMPCDIESNCDFCNRYVWNT